MDVVAPRERRTGPRAPARAVVLAGLRAEPLVVERVDAFAVGRGLRGVAARAVLLVDREPRPVAPRAELPPDADVRVAMVVEATTSTRRARGGHAVRAALLLLAFRTCQPLDHGRSRTRQPTVERRETVVTREDRGTRTGSRRLAQPAGGGTDQGCATPSTRTGRGARPDAGGGDRGYGAPKHARAGHRLARRGGHPRPGSAAGHHRFVDLHRPRRAPPVAGDVAGGGGGPAGRRARLGICVAVRARSSRRAGLPHRPTRESAGRPGRGS